ncbi:MAG TPA: baseplate J/gp47 family protein, partial [Polyangiaceae bacterium]|nr:baseplate J/gp47 family protein [Polyangiaceae bacterium]
VKWMWLPKSLTTNYTNYPGPLKSEAFKVDIAHSNELGRQSLGLTSLFSADVNGTTPDSAELTATNFKALSEAPQSPAAERVRVNDVRALPRQLFWELQKPDFGWATYPALAAEKARAFAAELAKNPSGADPTKFQVDPPYAPKIQELSVSYQRSVEVELANTSERTQPTARLLHVHPFGVSAILATAPSFFPPYPEAGELYIGLSDLEPGQRLTLLVQLAEGSSDPEAPLSRVSWSYLDEYGWQPLAADAKFVDSTRNLINSGIVEVTLPGATTDGRLPGTLRWLRVSTLNSTASVCDCVAVETQAITARFHDRGNAPDHYQNPLPPLSIDRLLVPQLEIALVEQPYTSFGGRPEEASSGFETRVSERLRHKNRALSPWDYEHLVLDAFPQIYRAKCLPASLSEPGRVELVVIPDVRATLPRNVFAPKAPAQLLGVVAEFLRERAPSAASINVRNARYVGLAVRVDVRFKPDIDEGYAKERLNEELVHFLSPWAYDEGADLVIGGRVYGNSILDFIDRRPYVDYVANLKLFLEDAENPTLVTPVPEGYFASVSADDEVLVSAKQHAIETVSASSYQQSSFVGVNYARVEFDFIVG